MAFWRRPFAMSLPGTAAEVLAAATTVDPNEMFGTTGLLHPGTGLEIWVVEADRIEANLWTRGGMANRGPVLRGVVDQDGASARIRGTLSWSRIVLPVLFLPLLIPALVLAMCLKDSVWPGWHDFLLAVFSIAGFCAVILVYGAVRWPGRTVREEQALREALLRSLSRPDV